MIRTILLLATCFLLPVTFTACAGNKVKDPIPLTVDHPMPRPEPPTREEIDNYAKARATITTQFGKVVIKFLPDVAPMHVKNFIALAEAGFYNGTIFHRVIPGFMIQGGDPSGTGRGGPGYTIPAEFSKTKKHRPGTVSMSRNQDPNSAGSQFFIVVERGTGGQPAVDATRLATQTALFGLVGLGATLLDQATTDALSSLNGQYSIFGEVIEGMDVVDRIVTVPRDSRDKPVEPVTISEIKINYEHSGNKN